MRKRLALILLLNTSYSFGKNNVICPDSFSPLSYFSPVEGKRITICTKRDNGEIIKRKPLKTKKSHRVVKAKKVDENLKKLIKDTYIKIFLGLVWKSKKRQLEGFTTEGCQGSRSEWGKLLVGLLKEIKVNYRFSKKCSLQGEFLPRLNQSFEVKFAVKDIVEVNKVEMTVKMTVDVQAKKGHIVTHFDVQKMKLSGPSFSAVLNSDYKVTYLLNGRVNKNHGGQIEALSVNKRNIQFKEDVWVPFDE